MKTAALFQFHAELDLCRSRIEFLRSLNPGVDFYGVYGGSDASAARELIAAGLLHVHHNPSRPPEWNKRHTDLAVADWFKAIGRAVPFDRLHVIQWDLIFFVSLAEAYQRVPPEAVALTGLTELSAIEHFWPWTSWQEFVPETNRLFVASERALGIRRPTFACIGPGYSLPRMYLERSAGVDLDEAGHDELRIPLVAQALGCQLVDTGFYPIWRDPQVESAFNADAKEISPHVVEAELALSGGRRVFHPCRTLFDEVTLRALGTSARARMNS